MRRSFLSRQLLVIGGFCAAAAAWFAPSFSVGFLADDYDWLSHVVRADGLLQLLGTSIGGASFYRPVINLTFWTDHALFGMHPMGYHITNVLAFGLACGLIAVLLSRLTRRWWIGIAAGLLFLVNPFTAESVTWLAGRTDVWLLVFLPLTLILFDAFRGHPSKARLAGFSAALFLTLFTKENGVAVLPLLLLLDLGVYKTSWRQRTTLLPYAVASVVVAVFFFTRIAVLGNVVHTYNLFGDSTYQPGSPHDFALFVRYAILGFFASPWQRWTLAAIAAALAVLFVLDPRRQIRFVVLACFATGMLLLPTLGPISVVLPDHTNERFLLVPMVGVVIGLVALASGQRLRPVRLVLLAAVFVLWASASWSSQFRFQRAAVIHQTTLDAFHETIEPALAPGDAVFVSSLPRTREGVYITPVDFGFAAGSSATVLMLGNLPVTNSPLCAVAAGDRSPDSVHWFSWKDGEGFTQRPLARRSVDARIVRTLNIDGSTAIDHAAVTTWTWTGPLDVNTGYGTLFIPVTAWSGAAHGARTHLRLHLRRGASDTVVPVPVTEDMLSSGSVRVRLCDYPAFFTSDTIDALTFEWRGFEDAFVTFGMPELR